MIAEFKCSSAKSEQCPSDGLPEFALIGRSNVGKSSLINMLTDNKSLAKVSGTPGKTRLINHFTIDNTWYLVDLPGYGYARASKDIRAGFSSLITDYLTNRSELVCLFVLIDVRHEPQKIDVEFMNYLGENHIPFAMIFTKCDKITPNQAESNVARYRRFMRSRWDELPPMLLSSSEKKKGRDEILDFISKCMPR